MFPPLNSVIISERILRESDCNMSEDLPGRFETEAGKRIREVSMKERILNYMKQIKSLIIPITLVILCALSYYLGRLSATNDK